MSKHLILFDIDGTLLRTQGMGRAATRAAMQDVFGTAGTVDALHFGGKTDWGILLEVLAHEGYTAASIGTHLLRYEQALAAAMQTMLDQYDLRVLPGALDSVVALRPRPDILLGILTGNLRTTANLKLRAAGFDPDWFPITAYGSESTDRNDLSPLALARACDHLGDTPLQVTIIGDTPADIACARVIDAQAVAVCTGFASRDELAATQPDILLDDLTGLLPALALA